MVLKILQSLQSREDVNNILADESSGIKFNPIKTRALSREQGSVFPTSKDETLGFSFFFLQGLHRYFKSPFYNIRINYPVKILE